MVIGIYTVSGVKLYMERKVEDKSIVNEVAKEVKVFEEDINEIYIQINDIFELQYVIYILILNPNKKVFVYGESRDPADITNFFYKASEMMRVIGFLFDNRFFIERYKRKYETRFYDDDLKNLSDMAPIIPVFTDSSCFFRDFKDIYLINKRSFSSRSDVVFFLLIRLIEKMLNIDASQLMNLDVFTTSFIQNNIDDIESFATWKKYFSECDVLDLLIFSYVMNIILKTDLKRKKASSLYAESIFWTCKNYSSGLLQLIENSIIHSQTSNGESFFGLLLFRVTKNVLRIELTDYAQDCNNEDSGYIVTVFKNKVINTLKNENDINAEDYVNSIQKLSDIFRYKQNNKLTEYRSLPNIVAKHYGLITFEHAVTALGGYFQVQSGKGANNYYSNYEYINTKSDNSSDSICTEYFELYNTNKAAKTGLPYIKGTHYEVLLPVGLFNDFDSINKWKYLSTNLYEEPFFNENSRQIISYHQLIDKMAVGPQVNLLREKNHLVDRIENELIDRIDFRKTRNIEIDFSQISQETISFRKFRIEVIVKACIKLFMKNKCCIYFSNMSKSDFFISCQLLIEAFVIKRNADFAFFLSDNSYENFVLLKKDFDSIRDSICKQCSYGALDNFAYRFIEAAARGVG